MGFGKRPSLTPAHQVDLLTGIGPFGASMEESRTRPILGKAETSACEQIELSIYFTLLREEGERPDAINNLPDQFLVAADVWGNIG